MAAKRPSFRIEVAGEALADGLNRKKVAGEVLADGLKREKIAWQRGLMEVGRGGACVPARVAPQGRIHR